MSDLHDLDPISGAIALVLQLTGEKLALASKLSELAELASQLAVSSRIHMIEVSEANEHLDAIGEVFDDLIKLNDATHAVEDLLGITYDEYWNPSDIKEEYRNAN